MCLLFFQNIQGLLQKKKFFSYKNKTLRNRKKIFLISFEHIVIPIQMNVRKIVFLQLMKFFLYFFGEYYYFWISHTFIQENENWAVECLLKIYFVVAITEKYLRDRTPTQLCVTKPHLKGRLVFFNFFEWN